MPQTRSDEYQAAPFDVSFGPTPEGVVRVAVTGEVDVTTADRLGQALDEADGSSSADLLLDLRELNFIDSSGLRVLLIAARRASRSGRRLKAVNTPPAIQRLFELTALDQTIDLIGTPSPR